MAATMFDSVTPILLYSIDRFWDEFAELMKSEEGGKDQALAKPSQSKSSSSEHSSVISTGSYHLNHRKYAVIEHSLVTFVTNLLDCVKDKTMKTIAIEPKTMLQGLQGYNIFHELGKFD